MSVHLSVTSSYTLMKSTVRIPELVTALKEMGYTACALCDHNVLYGAPSFLHACSQQGIKAIIGMEVDVDYHQEKIPFLLLSRDNRGYQNLLSLSSLINMTKEKTATLQQLIQYSQGCILIVYGEIGRAHV